MTGKIKQATAKEPVDITIPVKNAGRRIYLPLYDQVKKVRGIFKCIEMPGTGISFPFRAGWKGPIKHFTMYDGCEYVIPETLAKHLNEKCSYINYKYVAADGTETVNAKPITTPSMPNYRQEIDKRISRFMFQTLGPA